MCQRLVWSRSPHQNGLTPSGQPNQIGIQWIQENRGALLAAAFTLARAWFAAGCPSAPTPVVGGFEGWAVTLGGALHHAGVPGFLGNLDEMYDRMDPEAREWEAFLTALFEDLGEKPFTVAQLTARLESNAGLRGLLPTALVDDLGGRSAEFNRRLGQALAAQRGHRYGSRSLRVEQAGRESHAEVARWRVVAGTAGIPLSLPRIEIDPQPRYEGKNPADPRST